MRGFAFRGAGPIDAEHDDIALGGAVKLLVQNELRHTLFDGIGTAFWAGEMKLHGLVFGDLGLIGHSPSDIDSPRASIGVGIRLEAQKMNVGLDFALPVLEESTDRTQFLHFKISSGF